MNHLKTSQSQFIGALYILISAFFFATYGIWSRLMSHNFQEFSQAWTRGLILLIFVSIVGIKKNLFHPISSKDWPWFLLIGLAGGLNQAPYFFGFKYLPIGTTVILFYASLIIGGYILGKLVFHEIINLTKIISLIISLIGIFLIYKFSLTNHQIFPALMTIIAGFMGSISAVLPKKLSHQYHEFQIMFSYLFIMFIANLFLAFIFKQSIPPLTNLNIWLSQLAYTTSLLIANFTVIEGFKHLDASIGSLIGLAEIIFGILFGFLFFHEILTPLTLLGGLFILISTLLPYLKKI